MSGHTTFSARTNKFYQHMIQNEKRIMLRKELGLDPLKRDRDPILHPDVTPRNHPPTILDSKASTLPQLKERWKYPETDEGLVSQLPSQKEKLKQLKLKEEARQLAMSEVSEPVHQCYSNHSNETAPTTQRSIAETSNSCSDSIMPYSSRNRSYPNVTSRSNKTESTNTHRSTSTTGGSTSRNSEIFNQNIAEFKRSIRPSSSMLHLYRTKRALQYVEKAKEINTKPSCGNMNNWEDSNFDTRNLLETLKDTENQIKILELKVGLQAKTKSYELPKNHSARRRPSF